MEIYNPQRVLLFWTKVIVNLPDECWIWTGAKDRKGYPNFRVEKNKTGKGHRFSYVLHFGPIPLGLHVDHECNNRSCVNPFHLQLLTNKQNNERSSSPSAINKRKKKCKWDHDFDKENTIIRKDGSRRCKKCELERKNNYSNSIRG